MHLGSEEFICTIVKLENENINYDVDGSDLALIRVKGVWEHRAKDFILYD